MKIAIDISQIVYEGTGVANYTRDLVLNLVKEDNDNEYLLFGISFGRKNKLDNFVKSAFNLNKKITAKIFPIPEKLGNLVWNKFHIINIDKLIGKMDIFHSSDWIQPPCSAKKLTTVHDLVVFRYPETSHSYIIETQKRRLYWVRRECEKIIADSLSTKNDLIKILRFPEKKIEVVYPGIGEEFKPVSEEEKLRVKQRYYLDNDYILAVGTFEPRKNFPAILSAFERFKHHPLISAKKDQIDLVVIGGYGWGEKPKETENIKVIGLVSKDDLPALYGGAAFFVYPSLFEGFGLPVIEAMACGCPVITSDRGSLREISQDGAIIVDPLSIEDIAVKMTQLFVDVSLRQALIKKGIKNATRFNWQMTVEQIKEIYGQLMTN